MLVTRPLGDAQAWCEQFQKGGYEVLQLPLIEIAPVADLQELQSAWLRIASFDAVMFVSGNAVIHFFAAKPALVQFPAGQGRCVTRAWGTGPGTLRALLASGVNSDCIDTPDMSAAQFDSEALWGVLKTQVTATTRVLIVRGTTIRPQDRLGDGCDASRLLVVAEGRDWLAQRLADCGCAVEIVVAYQRTSPTFTPAQESLAKRAAINGTVWVLSSSEAINNLVAAFPGHTWEKARAVATHMRIAQSARQAGFGVVCESRPSFDSVVASIESMG